MTPPLVAVTITLLYVPTATLRLELTVSVDVPEPTIVVGVNLPLTNLGKPFTAKVTVPENPAPAVIVTA